MVFVATSRPRANLYTHQGNQAWKFPAAKPSLENYQPYRRTLLRFLWCEAAIHAVRRDPELKRFYQRKLQQKGLGKARVAAARKLGIRLWIMLRDQIDYQEFCRRGQMRQKSGGARAGIPEEGRGPAV